MSYPYKYSETIQTPMSEQIRLQFETPVESKAIDFKRRRGFYNPIPNLDIAKTNSLFDEGYEKTLGRGKQLLITPPGQTCTVELNANTTKNSPHESSRYEVMTAKDQYIFSNSYPQSSTISSLSYNHPVMSHTHFDPLNQCMVNHEQIKTSTAGLKFPNVVNEYSKLSRPEYNTVSTGYQGWDSINCGGARPKQYSKDAVMNDLTQPLIQRPLIQINESKNLYKPFSETTPFQANGIQNNSPHNEFSRSYIPQPTTGYEYIADKSYCHKPVQKPTPDFEYPSPDYVVDKHQVESKEALFRTNQPFCQIEGKRDDMPYRNYHPNPVNRYPLENSGNSTNDILRRPAVMPDKFDGGVAWQDYIAHFELCAKLNYWTETQKANYLAVSLRGRAQELLGDMTSETKNCYESLVGCLANRFGSQGQADLYRVQLRTRARHENESLPELAQSIRRLVIRAYPQASLSLREVLSLDCFMDALDDSDIRLRLKQNKPPDLEEAVRLAIELEAFRKAEYQRNGRYRKQIRTVQIEQEKDVCDLNLKISNLESQLRTLTSELKEMNSSVGPKNNNYRNPKTHYRKNISEIECYECKELGHYWRHCPQLSSPNKNNKNDQKNDQKTGQKNAKNEQGNENRSN